MACNEGNKANGSIITLKEWHGWGTSSAFPAMVAEVVEDIQTLQTKIKDTQLSLGDNDRNLEGYFKIHQDKKHKAKYLSLDGPEKKFQFYAARQIACRLLGSRDYLCQTCWLPMEDCMCSKVKRCSLWQGMRFWLYMHPKDFLRQNNTGKLLWQVFGIQAATLCLYGIAEHEEIMWNAFKKAGENSFWCLYPNQNEVKRSVKDAFGHKILSDLEHTKMMSNGNKVLNFILIDGTWNNSAAMFKRLKEQAKLVVGEENLPCISLATGASAMHKLRPQPSWDHTCTAAAALGLLFELHMLPVFTCQELDKQAEALDDAVRVLLETLTTRRIRMGRSITRKERHTINIC